MLMLKNEISSVVLLSIVGYMKMGILINFGLKYMVFERALQYYFSSSSHMLSGAIAMRERNEAR